MTKAMMGGFAQLDGETSLTADKVQQKGNNITKIKRQMRNFGMANQRLP